MSTDRNRNVYVGNRYVPLIKGEWDKKETYEGLSIVTYQGGSYTSKKGVPPGIDILNSEYWTLTGNYNAQIETYRKDVRDLGDKVENELSTLDNKFDNIKVKTGVSYSDFGAVLDGVTDDTIAIKKTHEYANLHGIPVIQRNSKFLLRDEIIVKTDVDLTGSILITDLKDPETIEYSRTYNLFKIVEESEVDITSMVNRLEFKKGVSFIPSLRTFESGSITIKTTEVDMKRKDGSTFSNVYKNEPNAIGHQTDGTLLYRLTKDFSNSTGFKVIHKPMKGELEFILPEVVLNNARLYSIIKSYRNNVKVSQGIITEKNSNSTVAPLHTIADFYDSHNIVIDDTFCPIIGRDQGVGQNGRGYLFLFTRTSKIRINNVTQFGGWSGVNGNWFRDIIIENSSLLSANGHACTYDFYIKNSTIYKSVQVHGGGILELDTVKFEPKTNDLSSTVAVTTRSDYAGEFEGTIRLKDVTAVDYRYLVQLQSVGYDCGRKVYLPNVEMYNSKIISDVSQTTFLFTWRGFEGDFSSTLPRIDIVGGGIYKEDSPHRTLYLPEFITNANVSGVIEINVEDVNVPLTTYANFPSNPERANIIIPKITNNNIMLKIKLNNTPSNFSIFGTSNTIIEMYNSMLTSLRAGTGSSASVTQNGSAMKIKMDGCIINRPWTDLPSYNAEGRLQFTIINSTYLPFTYGGATEKTVSPLNSLITYASNNKAEAGSTFPVDSKLFNYVNPSYWVNV